ncbi:MAG: two-component system cell cycle sensor histidine kinase/response regulator CckA [Verrucomicrobiales bacterium]|jgi:two-component system cell cycle sensor histidine kinase/response regulator CckA
MTTAAQSKLDNSEPEAMTSEPADHQFVLVVDDDESVLAMMRAILESVGYAPILARSGEEAIEIYKMGIEGGYPSPLVVLDLTLPGGINGLETFEALQRLDPEIRAIASSGYFDESAAQAAKRRGFMGILPKPFTAERLVKLIQWSSQKTATAA